MESDIFCSIVCASRETNSAVNSPAWRRVFAPQCFVISSAQFSKVEGYAFVEFMHEVPYHMCISDAVSGVNYRSANDQLYKTTNQNLEWAKKKNLWKK